ncbi:hypothetical protein GGS23DRAFT_146399 [Durotheca rogersii]|uniref:uncharacterized protein n=1 Tax=Durotheca rogersii TaxID=419775 RepID=UPI00221FD002|nr:uncharacterized protein GGS23DRAFT_146399 [Durotheca rogersii]KAI5861320.1 hypothetical protein GGS23DRAFT_146399 [Durotheca rogersii]
METTNLANSPTDRGRHRSLAIKPTTARAPSGSSWLHSAPHSPRSPLYTDAFTFTHPPIPPSTDPSPATPVSIARPPSPSHTPEESGQFQYALSSATSLSSRVHVRHVLCQLPSPSSPLLGLWNAEPRNKRARHAALACRLTDGINSSIPRQSNHGCRVN